MAANHRQRLAGIVTAIVMATAALAAPSPARADLKLCNRLSYIVETALGVEDKEWGHRLRAFVVKTDGASVDEDAIKAYVRDNLARYKVPREVVFLDELPRNPTGKILKRELRELDVE